MSEISKEWDEFINRIVSREKLPEWERMWDDFHQEEISRNAKSGGKCGREEEGNVARIPKGKGKGNVKGNGGFASMKDMSKLKCSKCQKTSHYASQCPYKRRRRKRPR